tara:strand:- start:733 stop:1368 length:636 start_codon:yes stop_codon:yes gene_type:complete
MTKRNVTAIFPTPIFTYEDVKEITTEEFNIAENELDTYHNVGNKTSLDSYILDRDVFKDLKNVLTDKVNTYFQEVYEPVNEDLKLYITQSWLNFTTEGGHHHSHSHGNSIVSGVFYFRADKEIDQIVFVRRQNLDYLNTFDLAIEKKQTSDFNAEFWGVNVDTNMLVMFPSTVTHQVNTTTNTNVRISLAFNTFIRGTLGSKKNLTEIKLL